jgi:hypothetical protein
VRDGVRRTESLLGPVDILVNSAGILYYTMMKNVHVEEWQQIVDVNIKGVLNCVGAVLGGMVERRQGHIVNISSDGGRKVDICTFFLSSNMFVSCGLKVPASVFHLYTVFELCVFIFLICVHMENICGFYTKRAAFAWNTVVMASNPPCGLNITFEMCSFDTVLYYYFSLYI